MHIRLCTPYLIRCGVGHVPIEMLPNTSCFGKDHFFGDGDHKANAGRRVMEKQHRPGSPRDVASRASEFGKNLERSAHLGRYRCLAASKAENSNLSHLLLLHFHSGHSSHIDPLVGTIHTITQPRCEQSRRSSKRAKKRAA
jgi:hypothetical protein